MIVAECLPLFIWAPKSADCETAGLEDDQDEVNCICQKIM